MDGDTFLTVILVPFDEILVIHGHVRDIGPVGGEIAPLTMFADTERTWQRGLHVLLLMCEVHTMNFVPCRRLRSDVHNRDLTALVDVQMEVLWVARFGIGIDRHSIDRLHVVRRIGHGILPVDVHRPEDGRFRQPTSTGTLVARHSSYFELQGLHVRKNVTQFSMRLRRIDQTRVDA